MKRIKWVIPLLIAGACIPGFPSCPLAQQPIPGPSPASEIPPLPGMLQPFPRQSQSPLSVEKVGPGLFRLGKIEIDKKKRAVRFPAQVNMDKGLLEYVLVRSSGKVHESLLRTAVEPYHLQIALLLLGFEGTDRPLTFQGDPERPKGEPIEIIITDSREKDGNPIGQSLKVKAEEWVARRIDNDLKDAGALDWVYTGSLVVQGRFLAQSDGSVVALYHDPAALIDNASPGGESDEIWFVKEGVVPPVGTPVTVTIKAKP